MDRLTYRDDEGRARLTNYGMRMYCSTQATADCFAELEESITRWISVKDRLPGIWVKVLSFQPTFDGDGCGMIRGAVYIGNGKWRETEHHEMMELPVTHWMPLPEPPEEVNDGNL